MDNVVAISAAQKNAKDKVVSRETAALYNISRWAFIGAVSFALGSILQIFLSPCFQRMF